MGVLIDSLWWKAKLDMSDLDKDMAMARKKLAKGSAGIQQEVNGGLGKVFSKIGPMIAAAFSIAAISTFLMGIVNVRSEFEKYEAVLTNTLGSGSKAQAAMADITQFASVTPFAVTELTSSFVKLANQGFTPTIAEMRKLGDLASSTGKGFDQLTEGILDATMGQWERMKEFGIKASQEGDKVKVIFKGIPTIIDNNAKSIRNLILSYGDLKGVTGSMEAISKTLGGQISNLGDTWSQFLNHLGGESTGAFVTVIGWLSNFIKELDTATASVERLKKGVTQESIAKRTKEENEDIQSIATSFAMQGEDFDKAEEHAKRLAKDRMTKEIADWEKELKNAGETYAVRLATGKKFLTRKARDIYYASFYEMEKLQRNIDTNKGVLESMDSKKIEPPPDNTADAAKIKKGLDDFKKQLEDKKDAFTQKANFALVWPDKVEQAFSDLGYKSYDAYLDAMVKSTKDPEKMKIVADAIASAGSAIRLKPPKLLEGPEGAKNLNATVGKVATKYHVSTYDELQEKTKAEMVARELIHDKAIEYDKDIADKSIKHIKEYIKYLQIELVKYGNIKEKAEEIQDELAKAQNAESDTDQRGFDDKIQILRSMGPIFSSIDKDLGQTIEGLAGVSENILAFVHANKTGDKAGRNAAAISGIVSGVSYAISYATEIIEKSREITDDAFNEAKKQLADLSVAMMQLNDQWNTDKILAYKNALRETSEAGQALSQKKEIGKKKEHRGKLAYGDFADLDIDKLEHDIAFWENASDKGLGKREKRFREERLNQLKELRNMKLQEYEIQQEFNELLTGTTSKTISDEITQGFRDGMYSVEDFGKSMNSTIRNALLTAFKANYIDKAVQTWYDDFAKLSEDGLTKEEAEKAKADYKLMTDTQREAWNEQQKMWDELGVNTDPTQKKQSALAGAIKGITEDTADVLAGQVGAIRINVLAGLEVAQWGLVAQRETAVNTRRLEQIESYLGAMALSSGITNDRSRGK